MNNRLYVGNLSNDVSEDELRTLFSGAGAIQQMALPTDRDTNERRGFAIVQMETDDEAAKAISLYDGHSLREQAIRVKVSQPKNRGSRQDRA
jgi:RNA recognition motif-containing protein